MNQGVRLTALYAYGCGAAPVDSSIGRAIVNYLKTSQGEEALWREYLGRLEPRHYYHLLLEVKHSRALDDFNPSIVRDYWFGNSVILPTLHTLFSPHDGPKTRWTPKTKSIGAYFLHQGVRPYHNFLVIAKAAVAGLLSRAPLPEVNRPLVLVDRCLIQWGKVTLVDKVMIVVEYKPLIYNTGLARFAQSFLIPIKLRRTFLKKVKEGDIVSFHYDEAREVLSDYQRRRLQKYTQLAIDLLNNSYRLAQLAKVGARK